LKFKQHISGGCKLFLRLFSLVFGSYGMIFSYGVEKKDQKWLKVGEFWEDLKDFCLQFGCAFFFDKYLGPK